MHRLVQAAEFRMWRRGGTRREQPDGGGSLGLAGFRGRILVSGPSRRRGRTLGSGCAAATEFALVVGEPEHAGDGSRESGRRRKA